MSVNLECIVSPFNPVRDFIGVYDAKMSMPGAAMSGCSNIVSHRKKKTSSVNKVLGLMVRDQDVDPHNYVYLE